MIILKIPVEIVGQSRNRELDEMEGDRALDETKDLNLLKAIALHLMQKLRQKMLTPRSTILISVYSLLRKVEQEM